MYSQSFMNIAKFPSFSKNFMMRKVTSWLRPQFFTLVVTTIACAPALQVKDVIDLPPPAGIGSRQAGDRVTVFWENGAEQQAEDFSGYLLYFSTRSLTSVPFSELPKPVELPPQTNEFTLIIQEQRPLFVHLRSCAGGNRISLPSLPELIIKPASESQP